VSVLSRHNSVKMQDNSPGRVATAKCASRTLLALNRPTKSYFAACHRTRPAAFASGSVMLRMMDAFPPPFAAALLPCNHAQRYEFVRL